MNNYEFCVRWVLDQRRNHKTRVLDYGCGAGEIVKELRGRQVDAFGCDVFYEGGDYSASIDPKLLHDGVIKRMDGHKIPFERSTFDLIVNNEVMEHVENIDSVLAEMDRVLKPGGAVLSLFPDKGVWREGHCGIPFLHWFPKGTQSRVYYAAVMRALGLGHHKNSKKIVLWSREFCEWLDNWTHYRTQEEINVAYAKYFYSVLHIEDYWLQLRLGRKKFLTSWLPTGIQKLIVRRFGNLVFVARKAAH